MIKAINTLLAVAVAVFSAYVLVRFAVYTSNRMDMNFYLPMAGFCVALLGAAFVAGKLGIGALVDRLRWWHAAVIGVGLRLGWALALQPLPRSDYITFLGHIRRFMESGQYPFESSYPVAMVYYGLLFWIKDGQSMVWLANSLLGGVQIACVWLLALRLTRQPRAAVLAAFCWALYPAMITFTPVMSSESPSITLMLLATAALVEVLHRSPRPPKTVLAGLGIGVLAGMAFYSRSTSLLLLPALGMPLLDRTDSPVRLRVVLAACMVFGFGLTLVPQTMWHKQYFGTYNFTTNPQGGLVLWYGTSRESNGRWNQEWQNAMIAEVAEDGYIWPDYGAKKEASRRAKQLAVASILDDPADFFGFALTDKFDQMWANDNVLASSWEASTRAKTHLEPLYTPISMGLNVAYIALWVLALAGAVFSVARGGAGLGLPYLFIMTFFGFHLFFEVQPRYHLLLMPYVCVVAGSGLWRLFTLARGDTRPVAGG